MRKTNTTLDREPLSSKAIQDRQNFDFILKETAASRIPLWKSAWFYGPVGIAMVTMVVSAVRMNPKNETYDKNITLSQFTPINNNDFTNEATINGSFDEAHTETKSDSNKENVTPAVKKTSDVVLPLKVENEKVDQKGSEKKSAELTAAIVKPIAVSSPVVEKKALKTMPDIAGVFSGRISVNQISSAGMIHCNNGYQIISYDIQYDNGAGGTVDRVTGSKIPSYICSNLKRYNVGSPVFITKIIAMNEKGERKQLLSMSLEPTF